MENCTRCTGGDADCSTVCRCSRVGVEFSRCWYDLSCFGGDQRRRQSGWSYLAGEGGHSPTIFTSLLQGNAHLQCSRWSGGLLRIGKKEEGRSRIRVGLASDDPKQGFAWKEFLSWLWKIKKTWILQAAIFPRELFEKSTDWQQSNGAELRFCWWPSPPPPSLLLPLCPRHTHYQSLIMPEFAQLSVIRK